MFFTTGLSGTIGPCGCTSEPLGGLERLAAVVGPPSSERALLDAGQLLLPEGSIEELTRPQHLEKARLIARVYRKLGVVAVNLAPPDWREGAGLLTSLQAEGAVPFVSANLRPRGEDGPMVARSFFRTVGGIRFGITGVSVPEEAELASDDVVPLEIGPALAAEVDALRDGGAEVVVVLAHLPEVEAESLAGIAGVDVILRAPGSPIEGTPAQPRTIGRVVLAEAGSEGQYVGRLRVRLRASRGTEPIAYFEGPSVARAERGRLLRRAQAFEAEAARRADQPELAAARRSMADKLRSRAEAIDLDPPPPRGPHLSVELIPIRQSLEPAEDVRRMVAVYDRHLRELNASRVDRSACETDSDDAPRFVGNAACEGCHEPAFAVWRASKHARAWETLEAADKHYDFTCVGCHTVGFRAPGGFCSLAETEAEPFRDVGCESCHGPGSAHLSAQDAASIDLGAEPATCTASCHVPAHSDTFEYARYRAKVLGPGHGFPVEPVAGGGP